jgi:hypothetical protein
MKTRLYPVPSFARQLLDFYLHTLEDFDGDYLQFEPDAKRDPVDDNNWAKAVSRLPKNHSDKADMRRINEFLEGQQWSCKGPVRLKYKLTVFHGGRLYTRYQQLPDKRHKIRINTLINDEPICEVDFSANHLRLAMAVLHDEDAGDNPYEDIMAIAGIDDRDLVKSFITTALGAASKRAAQSSWNKKALGSENFVALEQAVKQRYPKLILFNDWGIHAHNLEGAILRDVMLQALGHFGSALTALDHDPKSLAKVALIFSATGFAAYGYCEDFAEESQQLYKSIKSTLGEFSDHEVFH